MDNLTRAVAEEHIHDLQRSAARATAPRRRQPRFPRLHLPVRRARQTAAVGATGRAAGYGHLYAGVPGGWSERCA
ncbi:MAG: hypothetical protein ABR520_08945 [Mycobacteriales bacterium]|nr:hypothetical protein [Frankia sp.]